MSGDELRRKVLDELARPGAVSFIETFPGVGSSGVCGAGDWKCQHVHKTDEAARRCLNRHLRKEHGL